MKKLLLIALALVVALPAAAKKKSTDPATVALVERMLEAKLYKVDFDRANPVGTRSFYLNHNYYIAVMGDELVSYLPYFGRSYSVAYAGGVGLNFDASIIEYEERVGRKGQRIINFDVQSTDDNYTYVLTIYPNGTTDLNVTGLRHQSISFTGKLDLEPDFKVLRH